MPPIALQLCMWKVGERLPHVSLEDLGFVALVVTLLKALLLAQLHVSVEEFLGLALLLAQLHVSLEDLGYVARVLDVLAQLYVAAQLQVAQLARLARFALPHHPS